MFSAFVTLLISAPAAIEFAGMPPQLQIIRAAASRRRWKITCEGHQGEEGVIRIGLPANTTDAALDSFDAEVHEIASTSGTLNKTDAWKPTCDLQPPTLERDSKSPPMTVLAVASVNYLPRLLTVAKMCGFDRAYIRPWSKDDLYGRPVPAEWKVLDAGEDTVGRYGPTICYLNLGMAPILRASKAH